MKNKTGSPFEANNKIMANKVVMNENNFISVPNRQKQMVSENSKRDNPTIIDEEKVKRVNSQMLKKKQQKIGISAFSPHS